MITSHEEIIVKVTVMGESSVGKSCLTQRLVRDTFNSQTDSTIGAAYLTIKKMKGPYGIKFNFWDTAGQERYKSVIPMYIRDANIVLLVFDITKRDSFEKINNWYNYVIIHAPSANKILVGSKMDLFLERTVSKEEAEKYAAKHDLKYIECSSKLGTNVDKIMEMMLDSVSFSQEKSDQKIIKVHEDKDFPTKVHSCMGDNRCYNY